MVISMDRCRQLPAVAASVALLWTTPEKPMLVSFDGLLESIFRSIPAVSMARSPSRFGNAVVLPAAPPSSPIRKVGKYELRSEIGRGNCGIVYRGFDPFVQRDVAVKLSLHDEDPEFEAKIHERAFFKEARATGMLQHPHIVSLYDAGVHEGRSYIVMEYVDGDTLLPFCGGNAQRLSVQRVVDILFKCAKALDYAHSKGVLHRDVKPSNIMLTRDGDVKLMDFSIAEILGPNRLAPEGLVGSPLYMSPEQVRRESVTRGSDLYSLGAVAYHLLTGTPPFPSEDLPALFQNIRYTPAPRLEKLRPDADRALADIIEKLLSKSPESRHASGRELAAELSRISDRTRLLDQQLTRRESRDSLRSLSFFDGFSDDEIELILNASTLATWATGQKVVQEGEVDNAFYVIARGRAEVRKGGKRLHTLDRGDCFGEMGFLATGRRTATVVAVETLLTLKISSTLMEELPTDCQLRFYKVFTETLIFRLSLTSARLSALTV